MDEHLKDHDGEIASYMLMGEVARWSVARYLGHGGCDTLLLRLLGFLEAGLTNDGVARNVANLVVVGFVEQLIDLEGPAAEIIGLLGPAMSAEVGPLREFWASAGGTLAGVLRSERGNRSG